jgi:CelD/BcsL family acetyltransferase involved in cellulose biosynthesis
LRPQSNRCGGKPALQRTIATWNYTEFPIHHGGHVKSDSVVDFHMVTGLEGLKSLEASWRELTDRLARKCFYHEYDWFRSRLECQVDTHAEPIFVLARLPDKTLVAIFPLQPARIRKVGITFNSLQIFWPDYMDINDFILDNSQIDADLIHLLVKYLRRQIQIQFDLLELQNVPEKSAISEFMKSHPCPLALSEYVHCSKYITLGKTYEETTSRISGRFKRNLRRHLRNLKKFGRVEYATYVDIGDLDKAYEIFLEVEANSWKGPNGTGTALILDEQQTAFYREVECRFARTNQSRIDVMMVSGKPVAAQLGIISGDTLNLLKIAYDEAYKSMGPGGLLLGKTLEIYSGHRHINNISFVTGARWNDAWAPRVNKIYTHSFFQLTPASMYGYTFGSLKDLLSKTVVPLAFRGRRTAGSAGSIRRTI